MQQILRGNKPILGFFSLPDIAINTRKTRKTAFFGLCGEYVYFSLCLPK